MVDVVKLQDLLDKCLTLENLSDNQKMSAFIVRAKQVFPEVTMNECRQVTGYTSEDDVKNTNLGQAFRNNILIPTRLYITKKMFNLNDEQAAEIWKRDNDENEEYLAMRAKVTEKLPARSRVVKQASNKMGFLDEILGL